jgi:hypothetical protein
MYRNVAMITYTRFPKSDFTLFVSKGDTTIEQWLDMVRLYSSEGLTRLELYDLRLHTNLFSNDEIDQIMSLSLSMDSKHPRSSVVKTALLVKEVVQYGLSRMYEMKAKVSGVEPEVQAFYDITEAADWLGEQVKDIVTSTTTCGN